MRASVKAMQDTSKTIFEAQNLMSVEEDGKVVPVTEVFRIQGEPELKEAENQYLP